MRDLIDDRPRLNGAGPSANITQQDLLDLLAKLARYTGQEHLPTGSSQLDGFAAVFPNSDGWTTWEATDQYRAIQIDVPLRIDKLPPRQPHGGGAIVPIEPLRDYARRGPRSDLLHFTFDPSLRGRGGILVGDPHDNMIALAQPPRIGDWWFPIDKLMVNSYRTPRAGWEPVEFEADRLPRWREGGALIESAPCGLMASETNPAKKRPRSVHYGTFPAWYLSDVADVLRPLARIKIWGRAADEDRGRRYDVLITAGRHRFLLLGASASGIDDRR